MASLSVVAGSLILFFTLLTLLGISIITIHRNKKKCNSFEAEYDSFLSARNSQPWWAVGLSFYAAGMGSWLLFAPPETGYFAGWLGAIAYGVSNASPFWLMIWLGPKVKSTLGGGTRGFTVVDFVRERYGRKIQILVSAASLFFMFIFLCAELTSIGGVFSSISKSYPPLAAVIPVSFVTLTYIMMGGALASISTDRIQGGVLFILGGIAIGVILTSIVPELADGVFVESFCSIIVLWTSTTLNQFLDQGMWQRVFASRSKADLKLGLFFGGLLTIPTVTLFGCTGIFAKAAQLSNVIDIESGTESQVFFILLRRLSPFWLGIIVFLGIGLVCSTVDSLQSGLLGVIGGELVTNKNSLFWSRMGCVVINVAATFVAGAQYPVLSLFLISNIISCSIVPMLGLAFYDWITPLAVSVGIGCGIFTIAVSGWCSMGTIIGGFKWFILPYGPYHYTTAITFVLTPLVTTIVTIVAGKIHCYIRPCTRDIQKECLTRMKSKLPHSGTSEVVEVMTSTDKEKLSFVNNELRECEHQY